MKETIRAATSDARAGDDAGAVHEAVRQLLGEDLPDLQAAYAMLRALVVDDAVPATRLQTLALRTAGSGRLEALAAALVRADHQAEAATIYRALATAYETNGDTTRRLQALEALWAADPSELGARRRCDEP